MGKVAWSSHFSPLPTLTDRLQILPLSNSSLDLHAVTYRMLHELGLPPSFYHSPGRLSEALRHRDLTRRPRHRLSHFHLRLFSSPLASFVRSTFTRRLNTCSLPLLSGISPSPSPPRWKASSPGASHAYERYHDPQQGPLHLLIFGHCGWTKDSALSTASA